MKYSRITLFFSSVIAISVALVAFLFLYNEDIKYRLWTLVSEGEFSGYYRNMLAYHKRIDGNLTSGYFIFIGDSFIQGLAVSEVANKSVNFGIGYDTTAGVAERVKIYDSILHANAVIVCVATNDFEIRNSDEIISNFITIIENIPRDVPLVINAIWPVDEDIVDSSYLSNSNISVVNRKLSKICSLYDNVDYLDTWSLCLDASGNLEDECHIGDGVHLSGKGYGLWINTLRDLLKGAQYD